MMSKRKKIKELEQQLNMMRRQIWDAQDKSKQLNSVVEQRKALITRLDNALYDLSSNNISLNKKLAIRDAEIADLKKEADILNATNRIEIEQLKKERDAVRRDNVDYRNTNSKLQLILKSRASRIAELVEQLEVKESMLVTAQQHVCNKRMDIEDRDAEIADLKKEVQELRYGIADQYGEIMRLRKELEETEEDPPGWGIAQ